jgi:NAD(P)-dependent dehydrogenase (short-subunit alcohol dehydrogenase family)
MRACGDTTRSTTVTSDLSDRVAIVTGGGRGIGRGLSLALAGAGATVVVSGRTPETLKGTCREIEARGGRAVAVRADVRDLADTERLVSETVARAGRLDILVNNAQTYRHALLVDATEHDMDSTWRSGPLAVFRLMREAHPHLAASGHGVIVNFGSGAQLMHDGRMYAVYAAAKSAIESLTRYAAVEWGGEGIRAVTVMPAAETDGTRAFRERDPRRYTEMVRRVPVGRFGDPESDIGVAIAWLVSDDARYLTGSTVMLDGGQMFMR